MGLACSDACTTEPDNESNYMFEEPTGNFPLGWNYAKDIFLVLIKLDDL